MAGSPQHRCTLAKCRACCHASNLASASEHTLISNRQKTARSELQESRVVCRSDSLRHHTHWRIRANIGGGGFFAGRVRGRGRNPTYPDFWSLLECWSLYFRHVARIFSRRGPTWRGPKVFPAKTKNSPDFAH